MKIHAFILSALILAGCSSTRKAATIDRSEEVHSTIAAAQTADSLSQRVERSEWMRVTEIVERITEPVVQETIDPTTIKSDYEPSNPPRASPTRTIERTTRTIEGTKRIVEEMAEQHAADTLAANRQLATTEAVSSSVEREDSTPRNLRWIGITAISVALIFLLKFIKKIMK